MYMYTRVSIHECVCVCVLCTRVCVLTCMCICMQVLCTCTYVCVTVRACMNPIAYPYNPSSTVP